MASEYDPDDKLAQWVGGYFNGEGMITIRPRKCHSSNSGYQFRKNVSVTATSVEMAGLFDGEGYVGFEMSERSNREDSFRIDKSVEMNMTTKYDIERWAIWLESIGIEPTIQEFEGRKENWSDGYLVSVTDIEGVKKVLKELSLYLSKSKGLQAYIALTEIIPRLENEVHYEKRGFIECTSWIALLSEYHGNSSRKYTLEYFREEWPDVQPRDSHMAPSKEKFEEQLFGDKERETFEEKTGPSPRQPDEDWDGENDPFNI